MKMKKVNILLVVAIVLFASVLTSCAPYGTQVAGGWAGTTFQDGIIYAGTGDGRVMAINASGQKVEWSYQITEPSGGMGCGPAITSAAIYTTPLVDGDLIYIGTYGGKVLAFNTLARSQNLSFPQTRYSEWEWNSPTENAASNSIVADLEMSEDALYVSSSNGRVYSLDKEFGDLNWESRILDEKHRKLWTSPVLEDDTLYVSTFDGHIHALSAETGEPEWSFKLDAGFASSPVICKDTNTIVLGSFDRRLYAVKIGNDVLEWRFPEEPAGNWFWASPVVNEGIVYAGCLDGKIYAIEAETGRGTWEFDAGAPIVSSPVLMDNLLIVTDKSGTVYVFDLDGELAGEGLPWRTIPIDEDVSSSFSAHEGLIYIRDENNVLHVVDIDMGTVSWKLDLTIEE